MHRLGNSLLVDRRQVSSEEEARLGRVLKESLSQPWTLYEQLASKNGVYEYRPLRTFDSVGTFLAVVKTIVAHQVAVARSPNTLELVSCSPRRLRVTGHSWFRSGIEPSWEDADNRGGGTIVFLFPMASGSGSWRAYENVLLSVVGGWRSGGTQKSAHFSHVTGVRLVDRTDAGKNPHTRLEIWFGKARDRERDDLMAEIHAIAGGGSPRPSLRMHQ